MSGPPNGAHSRFSAVVNVLIVLGGLLAFPYFAGEWLADNHWVRNKQLATIGLVICILASAIVTLVADHLQRRPRGENTLPFSNWLYIYFAAFSVLFAGYGFIGHYEFQPPSTIPSSSDKPQTVALENVQSASALDVRELLPYRAALTNVADKFYSMVYTSPFKKIAGAHSFAIGPGDRIDAAFAFLIPPDKNQGIQILRISREKPPGRDLRIQVPEAQEGSRVLLLIRTEHDDKIYAGDIK